MPFFSTGAALTAALNALPTSLTGTYKAFDAFYYAGQYMGAYTGSLSPIEHFVQIGAARGYKPNADFDPSYYQSKYSDLAKFDAADLLYHYVAYGLNEGRPGNATLATYKWADYLTAYPDVAKYVNDNLASFGGSATNGAIAHYVKFGAVQGFTVPGTVAGQTLNLTTGVDNLTGGAGNDTFNASTNATAASNTLTSADVIDGGAGTDTLYIALSQAFTPSAGRIKNVENIVLQSPAAAPFDTSGINGATYYETQSAAGTTITNIASGATAVALTNGAAGGNGFTFKTTGLTGTADVLNLTVSGSVGVTTVATDVATTNAFESAKITSTGSATTFAAGSDLSGATVTSWTVLGDAALTVTDVANAVLVSVDASAMTGSLSLSTANTTAGALVKGGAGNDVFTGGAGNDTITGGAGNDTITAGAGNDNVDAGAGNDTVIASAVTLDDTIAGGAGTDTLQIGAAITYSTTVDSAKNISGFELLSSTAAATQNFTGLNVGNAFTGYVAGGTGAVVLQNLPSTFATLTSGSAATNTTTLGLKTNGTADALAVTVGSTSGAGSSSAVTLNATQFETLTVNSQGANGNSLATGLVNAGDGVTAATDSTTTQLTSLTITGNRNFTYTGTSNDVLATVTATGFTGSTLGVTTGSKAATTFTSGGSTVVTVTTGAGADTITTGSGNDVISAAAGANTINAGEGNNNVTTTTDNDKITTGAGDDTISGGAGDNTVTAGEGANSITTTTGNDTITSGAGADTINAGAGNNVINAGDGANSITTTTGNDSVTGGANVDTIDVGAGNDTVIGGAGNDVITAGTGSDSIDGGAGDDTLTGGAGDDTLLGGDGNDTMSLTSLTSGDSVDGGAGVGDKLTIDAVTGDATPAGIANVESFTITTLGAGTALTVDFANVKGITSFATTNTTAGAGVIGSLKNLPTTLTSINVADTGAAGDTLALAFTTTPSTAFTLNVDTVSNAVTNVTSVGPLTVNGLLNTDLAGTARAYAAGNASSVGNITTDTSSLTIKTDALTSAITGAELTVGTVTAASTASYTVAAGANSDITVGTFTGASADLATVSLTAPAATILTQGNISGAAGTTVAYTINVGDGASLLGSPTAGFAAGAVTVSGTLGSDIPALSFTAGTITAKSIASNTWTIGAGTGTAGVVTLPAENVNATTGTIGASTYTVGAASIVQQTLAGGGSTPATIGAITASGSGSLAVTVGATASPTVTATGANTQGAISAAGMTSSQSKFNFNGTAAVSKLVVTGSAGADTIVGGALADTITPGTGVDTLTGGTIGDTFVFNMGDSNVVLTAANATSNGQDNISDFVSTGAAADQDFLQFNITSADQTWDMSHIAIGTAGATTVVAGNIGGTAGYTILTVLAQAGAVAATDSWDIAVDVDAIADVATAQARSVLNLTGTSLADTLTTGANNDTINGGAGNDSITGAAGADSINVGAGTDRVIQAAVADSGTYAAPAANTIAATTFDVITNFTAGDVLALSLYTGTAAAASANSVLVNTIATKATTLIGSTVAANSVFTVQGTYTAATLLLASSFVGSTTGSDLLVIYDANATNATTAIEAVVIVGAGSLTASVTAGTGGLIGFA